MGKVTKTQEKITNKRANRSALSQQVTKRLQGADKTARHETQINKKKDPQKKHRLGTVSKKSLEGLNMFDGTSLSHISDVDKDRYMFILI